MARTLSRVVAFFCADLAQDPVAAHVFDACRRLYPLESTGEEVDGFPVFRAVGEDGRELVLVRTAGVLSNDYPRYLPVLRERYTDFDLALLVNWHEGANAPDAILMAHTTGDVVAGSFGPACPAATVAALRALERARREAGLDGYTTVTEATHWSGTAAGFDPALLAQYPVPLLDVEIGSTPRCWGDPAAAEVVARALWAVFDESAAGERAASALCVGGIHFEPAYREAVLGAGGGGVAVSHLLANHWLVSGGYGESGGVDKLVACAGTIIGGVDVIVFHDSLKGAIKASVRAAAERLGVPAVNHRRLRDPGGLGLARSG